MFSSILAAKYGRLLDLVKLIRLYVGFKLLDHKNYMKQIKLIFNNKIQKIIKTDADLADNQHEDNNYITKIIAISYLLKTFQLILIILAGSFFTGIVWYILSDYTMETGSDNFINSFDINSLQNKDKIVTLTYFAFTSLSTVGLGDFHPLSNCERLIGAFMLLFGVTITSLIIENLMSMILKMNAHTKSFEES